MTSFLNQTVFLGRQNRLADELKSSKINFLVLNPGPSLTYLTGLHFHLMERPVVAFFPLSGPVILVIPALRSC